MANKQIVIKLGADTSGVNKAMQTVKASTKSATDGMSKGFNQSGSSGSKAGGMIKSAFSGLGGILAGAFAVSSVVGFGKSVIEAAASAQVMESQFGQAFKGMEGEGNQMLEDLSSKFNILPDRLKAPMATFQSYFKGAGASAKESGEMTNVAMTLAADGAAYYDKSLEDTQGSLKSFLMGNYEAGDAIGISTNKTKIGAAYNEKYGGSFDDLNESQQQNYLLEYVEGVYALNGAMGQGERESKGYENVLGNLKSAWSTFMAGLGEAALPLAVGLMEKLTNWISGIDTEALVGGFMTFGGYIADILMPVIDGVITIVQALWDKFKDVGGIEIAKAAIDGVKEGLDNLDFSTIAEDMEAFIEKWAPLLAAIGAAAISYGIYTLALGLKSAAETVAIATMIGMSAAGTALSAVMAFLTSPVTLVIAAIAALVAIGVYLWQNWDTISAKGREIWTALGEFFSGLGESISSKAQEVWAALGAWFSEIWTTIKQKASEVFNGLMDDLSGIWTGIKDAASTAWNFIKALFTIIIEAIVNEATTRFNNFKTNISAIFSAIGTFFSTIWEGIKTVFTTVVTAIVTGVVTYFTNLKNNLTTIFNAVRNVVSIVWDTIKSVFTTVVTAIVTAVTTYFTNLKNNLTNIFNAVKNVVSSVWNTIKTTIVNLVTQVVDLVIKWFNQLKSGVTTIFNGVKTVVTTAWNAIKSVTTTVVTAVVNFVKNLFTTMKNTIQSIFNSIKSVITNAWNLVKSTTSSVVNSIKSTVTNVFNSLKSTVTNIWNSIKTAITSVWNTIKSAVSTAVNSVKSTVTNTFNSLKSTVTSVWNGIKTAITTPINAAKNAVKTAIDKIKGFMKFEWSLPKLKMPSFSVSGKFGLNPPSVPKMGLSWHKAGGIVKGTQGGTVVGMGEDGGDEAILPLSNKGRMKPFAHAVASMMPDTGSGGSDGGGDIIITGNTFAIREEADIKKVAQELYKLEQRDRRAKGKGN